MPPFNRKVTGAIFDVKPVDDTGTIDVQKIDSVVSVVNLNHFRSKKAEVWEDIPKKAPEPEIFIETRVSAPPEVLQKEPVTPNDIRNQFQDFINNEADLEFELAKFGAQPVYSRDAKPRYRVIRSRSLPNLENSPQRSEAPVQHSAIDPKLDAIIYEINRSSRIVDHSYEPVIYQEEQIAAEPAAESIGQISPQSFPRPPLFSIKRLFMAGAVTFIIFGFVSYAFHVKEQVVQQSAFAVENLQTAHDDLKMLQFASASQDFIAAYDNFSKAGDSLNFMGATITGIIGELPGGGAVKSARNLLEVGRLLSDAGSAMTTAMEAVAQTGGIFDPDNENVAVGPVINALDKALNISKKDISKASALIADIDPSIIPGDKQEAFTDFVSKLPLFKEAIDQSADYAKFFKDLINTSGTKRYLVLFQNPSELRPVGGFPGTYGVITFKDGKLDNFFVDDVYNLDGQLKENIIPPLQLQHITPTWGMRDANWFIDFPTSARKIQEFYKKESGQGVDGVIAVNPKIVAQVLEILGSIEMSEYGVTLDASNVMSTIQDQVEYKGNRAQPKQIVKDFAPLFLQKIYSASTDEWLSIFNILVASMDERKILMFFNNLSLESFATAKGFGGQVQQAEGSDYVMPTITNVKGSKTDTVTDTSFTMDTRFESGDAIHTLTITRKHNGGNMEFGFYNKQNPAYVRVLVPADAELISISGNDRPNHQPLLNYSGTDFKKDDDLVRFETSGQTDNVKGVTTYREAGKNEFGFWMVTNAGSTKKMTLTYRVPNVLKDNSYQLYVQKQPGLEIKDFELSITEPVGKKAIASYPTLTPSNSGYSWSGELKKDFIAKIEFE